MRVCDWFANNLSIQNQNHSKSDFKSKSQICSWKVISNQSHKSKKWFQITIWNQLISNHSHHCIPYIPYKYIYIYYITYIPYIPYKYNNIHYIPYIPYIVYKVYNIYLIYLKFIENMKANKWKLIHFNFNLLWNISDQIPFILSSSKKTVKCI